MSALVASGALCLGFAANQMLKPAPAAQAATSLAAASAPVTTGSITTTTTPTLPPLPQANAPAPAIVVAQTRASLPALPPIPPVGATTPPAAGVSQAAPALPGGAMQNGATPLAATPVFAPAAPVPLPSSYRSMDVDGPYIAITFDDGPNPETTPKLLKILEARNIKATFFMLGTNAAAYPDVVRAVAAGGNEIGNHSWNHPQLPKLTLAAADKQIEDTSAAIEASTGKKPLYLRPPYGAMTPTLQQHLVQKYGITMIFWSVDPLDWKIRDAQSIYDQVMKQVRPGAIILAHDAARARCADREGLQVRHRLGTDRDEQAGGAEGGGRPCARDTEEEDAARPQARRDTRERDPSREQCERGPLLRREDTVDVRLG
ncbi:MAG: hypothetical protein B7Z41_06105 [Rhizobiales bacterium 12-66-7]|nr:MAG: hypothetical protein B7Z41_06105 [Rhizobiales bacterium 12-66-7]